MDLADWTPRGDIPREVDVRRGSPEDLRLLTTKALPYDFHIGRVHGVEWCYLGFWEGQLAHITWIFARHNRTPLIDLQPGEVELRHVHTIDSFRGRGIFGFALQRILPCLSDEGVRTVYAHVLEGNHASNRPLMKLGFRKVAIIRLRRTLGVNRVHVLGEEETSHLES